MKKHKSSSLHSSLSYSNRDYFRTYYTQQSPPDSSTFSFCIFNCQSPSEGGAIYFTGSSSSLTITDSTFYQCNSTGGWGGAVYCVSCGIVTIQRSSFLECTCTAFIAVGAGAMVDLSAALPEITENDFIRCSAAQDAGGLYIYRTTGGTDGVNLPVKECRFISCSRTE